MISLRSLRRLRRDQNGGTISLEFVLFVPVFVFLVVGGYRFIDAYRERALVQKAAFTVADALTREDTSLTDGYIDSMFALLGVITRSSTPEALRISVVQWDEDIDRFLLDWSVTRGVGFNAYQDADMPAIKDRLPSLSDAEYVVVVETVHSLEIIDGFANQALEMREFVFARPRFAPTVPYF